MSIIQKRERNGNDIFFKNLCVVYVLKCWSAPLDNLNEWVCHGDIFRTRETADYPADTNWTDESNYLYAYIINSVGCVAVSDKPEGPFRLLSKYKYTIPDEICCNGWFIDPGVLVDNDGRTYIYCGYQRSFMAEINSDNMYEIIDGSCIEHIIPCESTEKGSFTEPDSLFFEACSPRKIGDTY